MDSKIKLFIADDERIIRESIRDYIDWDSLNAKIVGIGKNGRQVLDFVAENDVDILITDICMPEMDGMELLERIAELDSNLRVIFITAHSNFEYAHQALKYGIVDDYILKPIHPEDLIAAVEKSFAQIQQMQSRAYLKQLTSQELTTYNESYFVNQKNQLKTQTIQCSVLTAQKIVKETIKYIQEQQLSLNFAKRYAMDIFHMIADELLNYKLSIGNVVPTQDLLYRIISAGNLIQLSSLLCQLVQDVCSYLKNNKERNIPSIIQSALRMIEENYTDSNFNLQFLADALGVSNSYISTKFKEVTGISFTRMLNLFRMGKAKKMLSNPNYKIYEIADRCGIEDVRYFSRLFRECTGQTPKEYRSFVLYGKVVGNPFAHETIGVNYPLNEEE